MSAALSRPLPFFAAALLLAASCSSGSDGVAPPSGPSDGLGLALAADQAGESSGTYSVGFTLPEALGEDLIVDLSLSGSANWPQDYALLGLQVLIPAGALAADFELSLVDDALHETDKTVVLTIIGVSPPGLVEVADQDQFTLTVLDDDPVPTLSFGVSFAQAIEGGAPVTLPVELSAVSGLSATVELARSGTADAADYTLLEETLEIPPGSTTANFVLTAVADGVDEGVEQLVLTPVPLSSSELGPGSAATIEILDVAAPGSWDAVLFGKSSADPATSGIFTT